MIWRVVNDPNFLGTVALANASDLQDALDDVLKAKAPALNLPIAFWIYRVKTVYPEFQPRDVLTDKAFTIFSTSVEHGCSAASGAFAALPTGEMLQPDWSANKHLKKFLERNQSGSQATYGPLLLVAGGEMYFLPNQLGKKFFNASALLADTPNAKCFPPWS